MAIIKHDSDRHHRTRERAGSRRLFWPLETFSGEQLIDHEEKPNKADQRPIKNKAPPGLGGRPLGHCGGVPGHRPLCLPMDGLVPIAIVFIGESAMKFAGTCLGQVDD